MGDAKLHFLQCFLESNAAESFLKSFNFATNSISESDYYFEMWLRTVEKMINADELYDQMPEYYRLLGFTPCQNFAKMQEVS